MSVEPEPIKCLLLLRFLDTINHDKNDFQSAQLPLASITCLYISQHFFFPVFNKNQQSIHQVPRPHLHYSFICSSYSSGVPQNHCTETLFQNSTFHSFRQDQSVPEHSIIVFVFQCVSFNFVPSDIDCECLVVADEGAHSMKQILFVQTYLVYLSPSVGEHTSRTFREKEGEECVFSGLCFFAVEVGMSIEAWACLCKHNNNLLHMLTRLLQCSTSLGCRLKLTHPFTAIVPVEDFKKLFETLTEETAKAAGNSMGTLKSKVEIQMKEIEFLENRQKAMNFSEVKLMDYRLFHQAFKEHELQTEKDCRERYQRVQKTESEKIEYANKDLAKKCIEIADFLRETQKAAAVNKKSCLMMEEIIQCREFFMKNLRLEGIEEFDPTHQAFDPNLHQSIGTIPVPVGNIELSGKVASTTRTGFKIKQRLLRCASVVIYQ